MGGHTRGQTWPGLPPSRGDPSAGGVIPRKPLGPVWWGLELQAAVPVVATGMVASAARVRRSKASDRWSSNCAEIAERNRKWLTTTWPTARCPVIQNWLMGAPRLRLEHHRTTGIEHPLNR